jgi:hypothetical protein
MKIMATDLPLKHWQRIAEQNGIHRKTFQWRLKSMTPKAAATIPLNTCPTNPNSMRQKSMAAGLDEGALSRYRRENPASTLSDHAVLILLQARKHTVQKTVREQALAAGLSPQLVYKRLRKNWPLEKAINTPPMPTSQAARIGGKARAQQKRERRQKLLQQAALNNASTL